MIFYWQGPRGGIGGKDENINECFKRQDEIDSYAWECRFIT